MYIILPHLFDALAVRHIPLFGSLTGVRYIVHSIQITILILID